MAPGDLEYFSRREAAERRLAVAAASAEARTVHQELAELYATARVGVSAPARSESESPEDVAAEGRH